MSDGGAADPLIGRTLGDFVLRAQLGEGGFGAVYRADQPALNRQAVIKVPLLRSGGDPAAVERFLGEARLASSLSHPYAAHIYGFGAEPDGLLWIAMEYVDGTPLDAFLTQHGALPLERFVPLLERICEVVHTAHEKGVVHRDLKPANVMVLSRAGRLLPKLLDFGIAKSLSSPGASREAARRDGLSLVGSPLYMAPEQWIKPELAGPPCDLYALGVLCYEVLTGRPPFVGDDLYAVARLHASGKVPPLGPDLPADLNAVIARAMAKRPAQRFPNALELAAAFRAGSGIAADRSPLPQLDEAVREQATTRAPQPIAEAVAALEVAANPHQALAAVAEVVRVVARYLALVALAGKTRVGSVRERDEPDVVAALRKLHDGELADAEWVELARAICRPYAACRELFPLPELVDLFYPRGADVEAKRPTPFDPLLHAGLDLDVSAKGGEGRAREQLARDLAALAALLKAVGFLADYPLAVAREGYAERWMGVRRPHRLRVELSGSPPPAGRPFVQDSDGAPLALLWPLVQLARPMPAAPEELFLFLGRGRAGPRLVALPTRFELHDEAVSEWMRAQLADAGGLGAGASVADDFTPYRGLSAFRSEDASLFFGREQETQSFLNRLQVEPLLAVVGRSGAGKSSFVQAGVIPALPEGWRAITFRPGVSPLGALTGRLAQEGLATSELRGEIERFPEALGVHLRAAAQAMRQTLVLVVDQFEEVITLCHDDAERRRFGEALSRAASSAEQRLRVIVTMRDDFLLRAVELPAFHARLAQALVLLTPPLTADLQRILIEPARRAGYAFDDPQLPAEMVKEVDGQPGALALLSFTAAQLWSRRDRHFHKLLRKAYEQMGGVSGALAQHAEETLLQMVTQEQALVREAFRHLVTAEGTRAVLSRAELLQVMGGGAAAEAVIEKLINARLLAASDAEGGGDRIEVVHEALLGAWPRLVAWRQEDAEGARLRGQLRAAARQWEERGRPQGLLWRDDALLEFQLWRKRTPGALTDVEQAFAEASLDDAARGRRRRRALLTGAFAVLTAGVMALLNLNRSVEVQRTQAVANAERATESLADGHFDRGRQLTLARDYLPGLVHLSEAYRLGRGGLGMELLLAQGAKAVESWRLVLRGLDGQLFTLAVSADGASIAAGNDSGTVRVWDAADGRPRVDVKHRDLVSDVALSPDGRLLASASFDGTVKLVELPSGRERAVLAHPNKVQTVEFSADGALVLTACDDGDGRVWDARTGALRREVKPNAGELVIAHFSPDGRLIVTGTTDGAAGLWSTQTGALARALLGHEGVVKDAAFSPDGTRVATCAYDQTARIWDVATGRSLAVLQGHSAPIWTLSFSPDGETLATVSQDGTARLWGLDGKLRQVLSAHRAAVYTVDWAPDSRRLLTASADGSAKVWDAETGTVIASLDGHSAAVMAAVFRPGADEVVTASADSTTRVARLQRSALAAAVQAHSGDPFEQGTGYSRTGSPTALGRCGPAWFVTSGHDGSAKLWDAATGALVRGLGGGEPVTAAVCDAAGTSALLARKGGAARLVDPRTGEVRLERALEGATALVAAVSPGGTWAVGARDGRVRLWSAAGDEQRSLEGPENLQELLFSPDGRWLAARGEASATVRVWDVASGQVLATLTGHQGPVVVSRFSPDGSRLVTLGNDKLIRVIDTGTWTVARTLELKVWPMSAAFSPDGRRLAVGCADGVGVVWNVEEGEQVGLLTRHQGETPVIEYSPDGRLILTGGDQTASLWDAATLDRLATFSGQRDTPLFGAFDRSGERFAVADAQGWFFLWNIERDRRSAAEIAAMVRCQVPLALKGSSVNSAPIDPACYGAPAEAAP
jgi:WD40 repeat protein